MDKLGLSVVFLRLFISGVLVVHIQVLACDFDSECSYGEKCCYYDCVTSSDCYGHYCTSDEQCGYSSNMACCENSCVYGSNCDGRSCSSSSDCSFSEYCCYGECQEEDCDSNRLVLVLIIVGSVFGGGLVCCCCVLVYTLRKRTRNRGRVIANRRVAQTTTTYGSTSYGNQAPPPQAQHHHGRVPPGNYPHYPPLQGGPPNIGAPPAYADIVGSHRVQQHVGAAEQPHPQPSAPSF